MSGRDRNTAKRAAALPHSTLAPQVQLWIIREDGTRVAVSPSLRPRSVRSAHVAVSPIVRQSIRELRDPRE